jgi:hypothetical protein
MPIAWIEVEKYAAKFPAAGNLFNFSLLTNSSFGQLCGASRD